MRNPFHEAREALATARRNLTAVNSLNATSAYATSHACETAVRALWREATGTEFPYQQFAEHNPTRWVEDLGLKEHYSPKTQAFLARIQGYALNKVRFEGTQAFEQHIAEKSRGRGTELVKGTEQFIDETEQLAARGEIVQLLRQDKTQRSD